MMRASRLGYEQTRRFQRVSESPLPDSNRRPLPYHSGFLRYLRELPVRSKCRFAGLLGLGGLGGFR
jgi:hypothetical protein